MSTPLDHAKYINLETFRKDGSGVKTPVWVAPLDGKLVIYTAGTAYKVKRVRNNPKVRLAECNGSGKKILGPWHDGTARILDAAGAAAADAALNRKYGVLRRVATFFSTVAGKAKDRVYIEITLGAS